MQPQSTNPTTPRSADGSSTHVHPEQRWAVLGGRMLTWLVYFMAVFSLVVLFLAFILLLFGAGDGAPFVSWVYRSADRAMQPFRGVFPSINLGQTGDVQAVFEPSILFAMLVYGIGAIGLHSLVDWLTGQLARLDRADEDRRRDAALRDSGSPLTPTAPRAAPPTQPR